MGYTEAFLANSDLGSDMRCLLSTHGLPGAVLMLFAIHHLILSLNNAVRGIVPPHRWDDRGSNVSPS